ncbi:MAG: FAD-dependent oxidoreductase [Planctomycetota bacterium]
MKHDPSSTRTWRLLNLSRGLEESEQELRLRACRKAGVSPDRLRGFRIARQSLDARRLRGEILFRCQVDLILPAATSTPAMRRAQKAGKLREAPKPAALELEGLPASVRKTRVVVVGAGPGGLFAAVTLARNGARVTVIDRGDPIPLRGRSIVAMHRYRRHDPESNLLFGEGGAGTYSDGKLYTRVDDPLEVLLLEELVACGAQQTILYDARAHIGTDRLHRVIPALRERLRTQGVEFHWRARMEGLAVDDGPPKQVRAVKTSGGELPCDAVLVAVGHSARDSWSVLASHGVLFESRPFQFGVRVEHPQSLIDRARFGTGKERELLGAASYNLVMKQSGDDPGAHSFCMCPGGRIVASISDPGHLCTNGTSNSRHSSKFATAAIVTTVRPADWAPFGDGPFAGVAFQRHFEKLFFDAGGGDYTAPSQRVPDFLSGRLSEGELRTSYLLGARPERIDELLPPRVRDALRKALLQFDQNIPDFAGPEGLLIGVESRSSGPVRIPRDRETARAVGFSNLYPVGEGAGHAGGIMSAALDGANSARALLRTV